MKRCERRACVLRSEARTNSNAQYKFKKLFLDLLFCQKPSKTTNVLPWVFVTNLGLVLLGGC